MHRRLAVVDRHTGEPRGRRERQGVEAAQVDAARLQAARVDLVAPAVLERDAQGYVARSTGTQSSGVLLSMAVADGLLVVPGTSEGFAEGDVATVQLLDGTTFQNEAGFEGRL